MADDDELIRQEAERRGLTETMFRMLRAAGTDVVQAIVWDHVGRPSPLTPASMNSTPGERSAPERGDGWRDAKPLSAPPGIEHVDALCEAQAERERRQAILQAAEEAEVAWRLEQRRRDRELDPVNSGLYKSKADLDEGR
jgi:hypothetical protein